MYVELQSISLKRPDSSQLNGSTLCANGVVQGWYIFRFCGRPAQAKTYIRVPHDILCSSFIIVMTVSAFKKGKGIMFVKWSGCHGKFTEMNKTGNTKQNQITTYELYDIGLASLCLLYSSVGNTYFVICFPGSE